MGYPLTDITIYNHCYRTGDKEEDLEFTNTKNYIADYYHTNLNQYKPPKTARICIGITNVISKSEPKYTGSICHYDTYFDYNKYQTLDQKGKYKYVTEVLHESIIEIAELLNWDKKVFIDSYNKIINTNFNYLKEYPWKKSQDRKKVARALIEKDYKRARLNIEIQDGFENILKYNLIEKRNWFWLDGTYFLAKNCKWIDKNTFGYLSKSAKKYSYYNMVEGKVITNIIIPDSRF